MNMDKQAVTTFGKVLRYERNRKGMNQTQLGKLVGTSQQNIGHWEAGRTMPKQESFEKLLEIFGHESPLSLLPPRDEIRLSPKAGDKADERVVLEAPFPTSKAPQQVDFSLAARDNLRSTVLEGVKTGLPEHLHSFLNQQVDYKGRKYSADYLSPKSCVKVYTPADERSLLTSARIGMQAILVLKAALQSSENNEERAYLLLVVTRQSASNWLSGEMRRIESEADALGILICFLSDLTDLPGVGEDLEQIERIGMTSFRAEHADMYKGLLY